MIWTSACLADFSDAEYRAADNHLSPSRHAHIDRITHQKRRQQSLAGEILVKKLLSIFLNREDVIVHCDEHGKPFADGAHISIAHCDDMVVCAVHHAPVGIDIERIRTVDDKLIHRVCTADEAAFVRSEQTERRFCEIWTAKEAFVKMTGQTSTPFHTISVSAMTRQMIPCGEYLIQIVTAE